MVSLAWLDLGQLEVPGLKQVLIELYCSNFPVSDLNAIFYR